MAVTGTERDNLSACWSPDGAWIATESATDDIGFADPDRPRRNQIWIQRIDGSETRQLTDMEAYNGYPAWSPDGSRIAFDCNPAGSADEDGHADIYDVNIDGSGATNLTNNPVYNEFADWSADGGHIAFVSNRDGNYEIYIMRADGTKQIRLTNNAFADSWPSWSPF